MIKSQPQLFAKKSSEVITQAMVGSKGHPAAAAAAADQARAGLKDSCRLAPINARSSIRLQEARAEEDAPKSEARRDFGLAAWSTFLIRFSPSSGNESFEGGTWATG